MVRPTFAGDPAFDADDIQCCAIRWQSYKMAGLEMFCELPSVGVNSGQIAIWYTDKNVPYLGMVNASGDDLGVV